MNALLLPFMVANMAVGMAPNPQPITVSSKIDHVTVYLAGAQIQREAWFTAQTGVSEVVFSGVSPYTDANSLQARGLGDFTILDVKYDVYHPQPDHDPEDPKKIPADVLRKMKVLRDSVQLVDEKLEEIRTRKEIRTLEKQMLLNNGTVKGVGKVNDSIQLLQAAMNYFHAKMTEINMDLLEIKKTETKWAMRKIGVDNRLRELQNWSAHQQLQADPKKGPDHRIIVTVSTDKPVKGKIEIAYLASNAGWKPQYDIRAKNANSPVELQYKAQVYQNTGEEWDQVKLILSSSNPYVSQTKPEMTAWYIDYYNYNQPHYGKKAKDYQRSAYGGVMEEKATVTPNSISAYQEDLNLSTAKTADDFTVVSENMISAEFKIDLPYTIQSDNKQHLVAITHENLKTDYLLAMVPKLDKNAFLVGYVSDWEDLNLLPAKANIYYDGTYVGQSFLDPSAMEDTLKLALGRDNSVTATRKKLKDKEKEKILGDSKVKEYGYEINVKNMHGYSVKLVIEDQIPVSRQQDIKVDLTEKGKAELTEYNGFLKWRVNIKPGGSEKVKFQYSIKFDKNKNLSVN